MKPVLTVLVAAVLALGPGARPAAARASEGAVTSLSVVPTSGRADVVIGVAGDVTVRDFTLRSPDRIVLDLTGASLGMAGRRYDGVARGGITDVKFSQYRKNTVRVVLYLDGARSYELSRGDGAIHVAVTTDAGAKFAAWHLGAPASAPAAASVASGPAPTPATPAAKTVAPAPVKPAGEPVAKAPAKDDAAALLDPAPALTTRQVAAQQRQQQPRITVTYQGSDIRDVLAAFAAFSGRTIIPSSNVGAIRVDAEIRDQPWDVALQAILSAQGLGATEDANGIIIVDTQDRIASRAQSEPLATRVVRLNYQRATPVAEQVRSRLMQCIPSERASAAGVPSTNAVGQPTVTNTGAVVPGATTPTTGFDTGTCHGRGTVSGDEVTNSVSITAPVSMVDELVDFVNSLDMRQPQVNIKAKIVLVNRTELDALGIKYDLGSPKQFFSNVVQRTDSAGNLISAAAPVVNLGGNTVSAVANANGSIPNAALKLIYSTALGAFDFTTFLDALQSVDLVDIQSEPSVTILNNRSADLTSGTEISFAPVTGGNGGALNVVVNAVRIQTGVKLNVTPSVTNNRQIMMKVVASKSTFAPSASGPLIDNNSTSTEVLVADGQTIVIGGLTETSVQETKTGIPLLVDLPLIGRLFGYTSRTESRRDMIILLTPHIIDEGQAPSEPARR